MLLISLTHSSYPESFLSTLHSYFLTGISLSRNPLSDSPFLLIISPSFYKQLLYLFPVYLYFFSPSCPSSQFWTMQAQQLGQTQNLFTGREGEGKTLSSEWRGVKKLANMFNVES